MAATSFDEVSFSSTSSIGEDGRIAHCERGTVYGEGAAIVYSHGPDGDKLLNPVLEALFSEFISEGTRVVDLGCGPANEAIRAAQLGAAVFALDFQESMVEQGKIKVWERNLQDRVRLERGDASDLSGFEDVEERDLALSILVGCNLPDGTFDGYFREMGRVLKEQGRAIVVLPSSLDQVFTQEELSVEEAKAIIEHVLRDLPNDPSPEEIETALTTLRGVYSATFVMNEGRLVLVTDLAQLSDGQQIWRKLPKLAIPNIYWSERKYSEAYKVAKLQELQKFGPCFEASENRRVYNASVDFDHRLGTSYDDHPIFTTIILEKRG